MARLNKLDCEYTLEEAKKDVDENDITKHPFFKKHFASSPNVKGYFGSSKYAKPDKDQDHVIHYIIHTPLDPYHESNIDHAKHAVKIETQHYGKTRHIGHGRGRTVHEAMNVAIHTYKHPVEIKPLTESLVNKKPATASKLFAEGMEARLDEISNKTLRSYISKSIDKEGNYHRSMITPAAEKIASRVSDSALINRLNYQDSHEMPRDPKKRAIAGITRDATHTELKNRRNPAHPMTNQPGGKQYLQGKDRIKFFTGKRVKEDLDEVEAPANFWNAGMAKMNPIQVSQKQPAEPGQFKATLTKSPKRLADQDSSLEGKPRAVRDETETVAASRGPKTIELTGDWHADVPDHDFDPKLDSETEFYPLFSQFKAMGAYPSGPARAWESEEIEEDELNEISKKTLASYIVSASKNAADRRGKAELIKNYRPHPKSTLGKLVSQVRRKENNRLKGIEKAAKKLSEDELNEISKKLTGKYVELAIRDRDKHIEDATHARASADALQNVRTGTNYVADDKKRDLRGLLGDMERKARDKKYKRERGIVHALNRLTKEDLDEDSVSLMTAATKDEKKAAEQDKKKPSEFKKLHDKHETEVKSKMKELGEEALDEISDKLSPLKKFKVYTPKYDTHAVVSAKNKKEAHTIAMSKHGSAYEGPNVKITRVPDETLEEGLFDPAKQPLLALWDEHARRADAKGSGSRNEILKRIEDHVAKKHGQEGLKKMKLHTDLTNALKHSLSPDKGHLQAILGNMRSRCAMGV